MEVDRSKPAICASTVTMPASPTTKATDMSKLQVIRSVVWPSATMPEDRDRPHDVEEIARRQEDVRQQAAGNDQHDEQDQRGMFRAPAARSARAPLAERANGTRNRGASGPATASPDRWSATCSSLRTRIPRFEEARARSGAPVTGAPDTSAFYQHCASSWRRSPA